MESEGRQQLVVARSKKRHPEFDFAEAKRLFAAVVQKELHGEFVTSPFDLYAVETLRDRLKLRVGKPEPTDVFVFGKGEPPKPDLTKVGGVPYWPAGRDWPKTPKGRPYYFLAQFNFTDSRDLVPHLPGDVLSLLVADPEEWMWEPSAIRGEWLQAGLDVSKEVRGVPTLGGPFYGAICRAEDYPDADEVIFEKETGVDATYLLPVLNGTKIGGPPHAIQSAAVGVRQGFLCQLTSIAAAPEVPFPWVNRAKPLTLDRDEENIYSTGPGGNSVVFADMGNLYVFRDAKGVMSYMFESY